MKSKGLKAARRLITKVHAKPGIGSDQRDQLRRAKRQLDKVAQSGKLDGRRMILAIQAIGNVLLEVVEGKVVERRSR
ncbi:MAG: hypothetical protein OXG29_08670 [Gammaproteobacteria bacterium]|nr:hypothetical protein [Gammaproteobacteria bacterium]